MPAHLTAPRWTHVALPSLDIERSVAWYKEFTPLVELAWFDRFTATAALSLATFAVTFGVWAIWMRNRVARERQMADEA